MLKNPISFYIFLLMINLPLGSLGSNFQDSTINEKSILHKLELAEENKYTDIKQAMQYAKEALSDAKQLNDKNLIGESNLALGKCYDFLGGSIEALDHLTEAQEIFTELQDKIKIAQTYKQIGSIYYYSQDYATAMNYYQRVYKCGVELKDTLLNIEALMGRGSVYGNTNKMDSALLAFNESFVLAQKIGDKTTEVQSLFYMGDVNLYSDKPEVALKIFKQVEENYDLKKYNPRIIPSVYNSMTYSYIKIGNISKAKVYNQKAGEALEEIPRLNQKVQYYNLKFRIDTLEKNYKAAVNSYLEYNKLNDSLNNAAFREKLTNYETLYELSRKEGEIDKLKLDNKLKDISIKQKRIMNYGSLTLIVLLFVIVFQIFRSAKRTKQKNLILQEQQEELATANEELLSTNEELHTQREELEVVLANLQNTQKQLIHAEKMASLGVLAAGVAHEINNPLNFIKGGITGIEDYVNENLTGHSSDLKPLIEGVNIGVERAAKIVTSLNHYSRQDDTPQSINNVHAIIDNCLIMLHNQLKNRVEVVKDYFEKPINLMCNEGKLHQAFLNILANASQAIDDKGKIEIKTFMQNGEIIVSVKDSGCGICKENLTKIFDPFFTTKDPGKGTGLGLSITYNIIKEHEGEIEFDSKPNIGTTVKITLPINNIEK